MIHKRDLVELETLYGTTSTGKTKVWNIQVWERMGRGVVEVSHGELGGKMQSGITPIKVGKNIGRSNETTPYQQALKEAKAAWKKKLDRGGYRLTIEEDEAYRVPIPMMALSYRKRSHNIDWEGGVYVQPKLNGVRNLCDLTKPGVQFSSKQASIFEGFKPMKEAILDAAGSSMPLDGELFNPEMEFEDIITEVKNGRCEKLQYWVYDVADETKTFEERCMMLKDVSFNSKVRLVPTIRVKTPEELEEMYTAWLAAGYEGIIVRNAKGMYRYNHRTIDLQKMKPFIDQEFRIIGGKEGTGKAAGQCVFRCVTDEGKEFSVRCTGSNELREEQWQNLHSYIGKLLTVRFDEWTKYGLPRDPRGLAVRDYE